MLEELNIEQLGTAGVTVAIVLFLYFQERKERKYWQQAAFDVSRDAQKELFSAVQTFKEVAKQLGAT